MWFALLVGLLLGSPGVSSQWEEPNVFSRWVQSVSKQESLEVTFHAQRLMKVVPTEQAERTAKELRAYLVSESEITPDQVVRIAVRSSMRVDGFELYAMHTTESGKFDPDKPVMSICLENGLVTECVSVKTSKEAGGRRTISYPVETCGINDYQLPFPHDSGCMFGVMLQTWLGEGTSFQRAFTSLSQRATPFAPDEQRDSKIQFGYRVGEPFGDRTDEFLFDSDEQLKEWWTIKVEPVKSDEVAVFVQRKRYTFKEVEVAPIAPQKGGASMK